MQVLSVLLVPTFNPGGLPRKPTLIAQNEGAAALEGCRHAKPFLPNKNYLAQDINACRILQTMSVQRVE